MTLPRLDPDVQPIWAGLAVLVLIAIAFGLRAERRDFAARGKSKPWLWLRLASVPIAAATVAAVILPARAVHGPEALAVFYGLMFTAGPAVYFGLHWGVGRIAGLDGRDAAGVGLTGLAIVLGPMLLAQFAQPWVYQLSAGVREARFSRAADKPLPHRVTGRQRFDLPGVGEVWTEHWQAPPGVKVERIEVAIGDRYARVESGSSGFLCRSGQDVHVLWIADVAPPRWRVHWSADGGSLARSAWESDPPQGTVHPFALHWQPDGFVLPVPVAREAVTLGRTGTDGVERTETLHPLRVEDAASDTCLPPEYRALGPARITSFTLRLWRWDKQQSLRGEFRRPAS